MANKTENNPETTEKTVRIRLPLSRENSAPVPVGLNDRTFLIKRGVDVEVPESVAKILEESERAKMAAFEYEQSVKDE